MNNKYFNSPDAVKRNRLILIAITFIITLYILIRSWGILYPFVIGFVLAYLALPLVNVLEEKMPKIIRRGKLGRIIAICLVYFGLLILLVATLYLFFSVVFQQVSMLASEVPSLTNRIGNQWNEWMKEKNLLDLWDSYQKSISQDVRLQIENQLQTALQRLLDTLVNIIQQGIGNAFDVLTKTLSFILGILIVPIWLFYVLNDAKEITQAIVNIVPSNLRSDFIVVMRLIDRIFDFLYEDS
jgi:predicted PurR-regulated permease PerM